MSDDINAYDASRIQVLEGWQAVRKRPGMFVGSIGERGLRQMVFEVADRAVGEALAGRATRVDVTLAPDGGVRVGDDGPGVPIEETADSGPGLEDLLTRMQSGAGAGDRHTVPLGLCGMGPFVVNALSSRLTAEVRREGVRWVQEYGRGVAIAPLTEQGPATGSGTTITFWPDSEIFGEAEFSFTELAHRFRELAFLNRDLEVTLTDQRRSSRPQSDRFRSTGGARDFVAFLDCQATASDEPDVIHVEQEDPRMAGTLEVALRWHDSGEERVHGFANSRPTAGGTHEQGFRDGLAAAVSTYARKRRLLTGADPDLDPERMGAGITAVVSVKLDDPEFHGPTREMLGGRFVRSCVDQAVREHLGRWLEEHPERAATIIGRVVRAAHRT
ncbi:ATP-binding protein [Streptomyces sp. NPDC051079]|uniref:ATP-binding protein n=1 Tax=Streptomyces sp. NPDC051079 TaxID=3155043 RepID=UPI00344ED60E